MKKIFSSIFVIVFISIQVNGQLIQPEHLTYKGAFLTPAWISDTEFWEYGGTAMTYYPNGDPSGPTDGYPGSIFAAGFDVLQYFSELTIPVPVISPAKDIAALNVAQTLQSFTDVTGGLYDPLIEEMPRVGVEYLPAQVGQSSDKLYYCWGAHFQELDSPSDMPSHSWGELTLAAPQIEGVWWLGDLSSYCSNDYLFSIPETWANSNTPGMRLVSGRYRDGGWSGFGPSLIAFGPWMNGNPPANGDTLTTKTLLLYSNNRNGEPDPWYEMNGYRHADEWAGGAWLTSGSSSAVIFVGTKGVGETWYGNEEGPCLECDNRGWWSAVHEGQMLFYDPADFAAVAAGTMQPHEPQPYAVLNLDDQLYHLRSTQQWYHVGAASYDRENRLLYIFEPGRFEEDRTLIHVWEVDELPTSVEEENNGVFQFRLHQNYPNPFNPVTTIKYQIPLDVKRQMINLKLVVYDVLGREVATLVNRQQKPGYYEVEWNASNHSSGIYFYKIQVYSPWRAAEFVETKKMVFMK